MELATEYVATVRGTTFSHYRRALSGVCWSALMTDLGCKQPWTTDERLLTNCLGALRFVFQLDLSYKY